MRGGLAELQHAEQGRPGHSRDILRQHQGGQSLTSIPCVIVYMSNVPFVVWLGVSWLEFILWTKVFLEAEAIVGIPGGSIAVQPTASLFEGVN